MPPTRRNLDYFYPYYIQEISKVVCKKTMSETCAFITSLCCTKHAHYSKRMLRKQDCAKFRGRIAWQSFFENNFADFSDIVRVKKNQDSVQPLVAFPISNISYCKQFQVNLVIIHVWIADCSPSIYTILWTHTLYTYWITLIGLFTLLNIFCYKYIYIYIYILATKETRGPSGNSSLTSPTFMTSDEVVHH